MPEWTVTDDIARTDIAGYDNDRQQMQDAEDGIALIFASREQLELLKSATQVYFDATFKVVPVIFYQLFTVFVSFADSAFPVLYALMSRKTQMLYFKVFERQKELVHFQSSH